MPRLPDATALGQRDIPRSNGAIVTYDGTAVGRAVQGFGKGIQEVADKYQQQEDAQAVSAARRQLNDWEAKNIYDPQDGAMAKRGKDAFDLPNTVPQSFDEFASQVSGTLTSPRQKQAFSQMADSRRQSLGEWSSRYALQQRDSYMEGQYQADIKSSADRVQLLAGDPAKSSAEIAIARDRTVGYLRGKGVSEEEIGQKVGAMESGMHLGAFNSLLAANDTVAAQSYLNGNSNRMSADDAVRAQKAIAPLLADLRGREIADRVYTDKVASSTAVDNIFDRVLVPMESGGKQFAADGQPLTSPKGATGAAQIMPATGPEAAKLAGLPWDEVRFKNDKEYNLALGRAYFGKQLQVYGGNAAMAAAAYNAGPGALDDWLNGTDKTGRNPSKVKIGDPRTGAVTDEVFAQQIPIAETRAYVTKANTASDKPSAQRLVDAQAEIDRTIQDPQQRQVAQQHLLQLNARDVAVQKERVEGAQAAAWGIIEGGGGYADIPDSIKANLPISDRKTLLTAKQDRSTDQAVYYDAINVMASGKPLGRDQMLALRPSLSNSDFQELAKKNADVSAKGVRSETSITLNTSKEVFDNTFAAAIGQSPADWVKKDKENTRLIAATRQKFDARIAQVEAATGKKATPDQMSEIANRFFTEVTVQGTFFNNTVPAFQVNDAQAARVLVTAVSDVPKADRDKIKQALQESGRSVTDAEVMRLYNARNAKILGTVR